MDKFCLLIPDHLQILNFRCQVALITQKKKKENKVIVVILPIWLGIKNSLHSSSSFSDPFSALEVESLWFLPHFLPVAANSTVPKYEICLFLVSDVTLDREIWENEKDGFSFSGSLLDLYIICMEIHQPSNFSPFLTLIWPTSLVFITIVSVRKPF